MNATATPGKRFLKSILYATVLVVVLSTLSFVPYLGFFAYPLVPGIDLSGLIFSSGVESFHLLRFEVASIVLNIIMYGGLFYFLFAEPRSRARRSYSGFYPGVPTVGPAGAAPSLSGAPAPANGDVRFDQQQGE